MHLFDGKEERERRHLDVCEVKSNKVKEEKKVMTKRQKLGETLQKLLLSISH